MKISQRLVGVVLSTVLVQARNVFYYDEEHPHLPDAKVTADVDHVNIAYAKSSIFSTNPAGEYAPFKDLSSLKTHFKPGTKFLISIGGWGDNVGFRKGAATEDSRKLFASNVAKVLKNLSLDGVDIDWRYPGGNGYDYRQVPNSDLAAETDTYPLLLSEIRSAIGTEKILSIVAPGKTEDMIAYTPQNATSIWNLVDWVNVMTYDLMNRRDGITKHHTDVQTSLKIVDHYINDLKLDPHKINLGFAMYAKWFKVDPTEKCETGLGCITLLLETQDGSDTQSSGSITFETANLAPPPSNITESTDGTCGPEISMTCKKDTAAPSTVTEDYCNNCEDVAYGSGCQTVSLKTQFQNAILNGTTDSKMGGQYYYDRTRNIFWTWETPDLIAQKFEKIMAARKLGGVMVWSLGQDSYENSHINAIRKGNSYLKDPSANQKTKSNNVVSPIQSTQSPQPQPKPQPTKTHWWKFW
ncbi:CELP0030 Effector like protein [Blumeria hordei DH14]|uniref:chitinase n=1 Tax=Blumeria graminis f. sp. hordei (strain DH14) TaxID=546991 RepID=N1JCH1_BLUG1|nr:CELP0030 Effector like protein [Blumeria hordei DH14]